MPTSSQAQILSDHGLGTGNRVALVPIQSTQFADLRDLYVPQPTTYQADFEEVERDIPETNTKTPIVISKNGDSSPDQIPSQNLTSHFKQSKKVTFADYADETAQIEYQTLTTYRVDVINNSDNSVDNSGEVTNQCVCTTKSIPLEPQKLLVELGFRLREPIPPAPVVRTERQTDDSAVRYHEGSLVPNYLKLRRGLNPLRNGASTAEKDKAGENTSQIAENLDFLRHGVTAQLLGKSTEELKASMRKETPIRSRKHLADSHPLTVCFHYKRRFLGHREVLSYVEAQLDHLNGAIVTHIQTDHLSVLIGNPKAPNRWLITLNNEQACRHLIRHGIDIQGDNVVVRAYDDVTKQEYDVTKLRSAVG